ncbi:hypothetical protein O181_000156 [Austropuccinia psidii MF-1]|uniref:Uncharacterized protein n=1 Tax=Austropuccinia psidii MF-1 TaxID=1389203 RepID=A0A9Q3B824_9BASI|nr:hypothetical protein [Austropuccinia psidii MF-1]
MQYGKVGQKLPRKEVSKCKKRQYHNQFNPEDPRFIHIHKSDRFGQDLQNKKWPNNLKIQLKESISKDELPNIIQMPIANNEENF